MKDRLAQEDEEITVMAAADVPGRSSIEISDPAERDYTQMKLSTLKSVPNHFSLVSKEDGGSKVDAQFREETQQSMEQREGGQETQTSIIVAGISSAVIEVDGYEEVEHLVSIEDQKLIDEKNNKTIN